MENTQINWQLLREGKATCIENNIDDNTYVLVNYEIDQEDGKYKLEVSTTTCTTEQYYYDTEDEATQRAESMYREKLVEFINEGDK